MKKEKTKMINRISEFFKTFYGLFMFGTKSIWIILKNDMKKNAQTYNKEREQQKKIKNNEK